MTRSDQDAPEPPTGPVAVPVHIDLADLDDVDLDEVDADDLAYQAARAHRPTGAVGVAV